MLEQPRKPDVPEPPAEVADTLPEPDVNTVPPPDIPPPPPPDEPVGHRETPDRR